MPSLAAPQPDHHDWDVVGDPTNLLRGCGGASPETATLGGATGQTTTSGGCRKSHLTLVERVAAHERQLEEILATLRASVASASVPSMARVTVTQEADTPMVTTTTKLPTTTAAKSVIVVIPSTPTETAPMTPVVYGTTMTTEAEYKRMYEELTQANPQTPIDKNDLFYQVVGIDSMFSMPSSDIGHGIVLWRDDQGVGDKDEDWLHDLGTGKHDQAPQ
ncbi:hypothetical protein Sjap_008559 [Stephania japonica]|uniref:Uncharacterized protein n=1 Tax=Stephania japonica TaxID=461633 RepID=A0AAP0PEQ9_9MAGN